MNSQDKIKSIVYFNYNIMDYKKLFWQAVANTTVSDDTVTDIIAEGQ